MKLPDFDEMNALAEVTAGARAKIKLLERVESMMAANFMRQAIKNKEHWISGRPPTQVVLEKVIAKVGLSEEDAMTMRGIAEDIAQAYKDWTEAAEKLQTCRDKIAIFQTESANKRAARL